MRGRALAAAALLAGCAASPPNGRLSSADAPKPMPDAPEPLRSILLSAPALRPVLDRAAELRLQIVLGEIVAGPGGRPTLRQTAFRPAAEYFYPASAVKLFAAVAALERLRELGEQTGFPLGVDTALAFHPLFEGESVRSSDPTNLAGGAITVRHELRKLFLVSDNEAFNRLYELVGQDGLAASLARAGLPGARIVHRLSVPRSAEENRHAPRVDFLVGTDPYTLPERVASALPAPPPVPGLAVGSAYLAGDRRIEGPMDFSGKNRIALADLQRGLCAVVRPDVDCGGAAFALHPEDRALLLEAMSQYPRESANPVFDPVDYPDAWGKLLLPGLARRSPRERLRIFNKFGRAYGFSTENAWVLDRESGRSFFLAATLYTNADGVLNDDVYDYETVATPFFAALGGSLGNWFWPAGGDAAQAKNR